MQYLLHSLEETLIDLLQLPDHRKEGVSWYVIIVLVDVGGCFFFVIINFHVNDIQQ